MRGLLYTGQNATGALQGPQGPVNGQSKRSTLGTYFDYNGVLRTAQPYQLRPNYVFDGSKWELDGFLKEGQATNHMTDSKDITSMFSSDGLSHVKVYPSFKGSQATYYEIIKPVTGNLWPSNSSWSGVYNSFYCRPPDGKSGTISYTYQAGSNNIAINIVNSKVTQTQQKDSCTLSSIDVGGGWFRILTTVPSGSNQFGNLIILPTDSNAAATLGWCFALPQSEDNTFSSPIITTGTALTRAGD